VSKAQTDTLPRYLTTLEAAALLRLSHRTLEKHRLYGTGPEYRKLGGRVLYATADVLAWAESGAQQSTTDPRNHPAPAKSLAPVPGKRTA